MEKPMITNLESLIEAWSAETAPLWQRAICVCASFCIATAIFLLFYVLLVICALVQGNPY